MNKEMQHWLDRNRPPRVQITYDVEKLGATVKEEIPFIVGIIGDFVGSTQQKAIAERTFVEIDRDSFEQVMQRLKPTLTLGSKPQLLVTRTPDGNTYAPDATAADNFPVGLAFQTMEDFGPRAIIGQVGYLKGLMQTRQDLADLVAKLGTDPSLETKLSGIAAPIVTPAAAVAVLATANTGLGTPDAGPIKLFNDAAAAVLKVEAADPNNSAIKSAQAAVAAAFGTATSGYVQASAMATDPKASTADVQIAGKQAWLVAAALRDGMALLQKITAGYDDTKDDPKAALAALAAAKTGVDALIPLAGTAALVSSSTLALNPSPPTPIPAPAPNPKAS
jgi:type VI secretion system protein ImpB